METILKVENLQKCYGSKKNQTVALDCLNFEVKKAEYVGIMGASGSGKTTLLNCISTIDKPTQGKILVDGQDVTLMKGNELTKFRREKLGFIFQEFQLLDTLTAYENIAIALAIAKTPRKEIQSRVEKTAEKLGITHILSKYPYQISGGEKQRVACARAVISNPAMVLADEPTGALDSKSAKMLLNALETLHKDLQATILMVTHDAFTASYCERILFIKDGRFFRELQKGEKSRQEFFSDILDVVASLGGDDSHVL